MTDYKRALVTGGAGFIGSHLVDALLERGLEVISLDNYVSGQWKNLDQTRRSDRFTEVRQSVVNIDPAVLRGVDVVFHLAASKKAVSLHNPMVDLMTNVKGTFDLLAAARLMEVKRFIHASTGSVYGEVEGEITEAGQLNPVSMYGVSKLAGEKYVQVFHKLYDLPTTVLRYFHVYGSRQNDQDGAGGVVAIFERRLRLGLPLMVHGDGEQVRSFTHVGDVVAANLFCLDHPETIGLVSNVASRVRVTINQLVSELEKAHGKKAVIEHVDPLPGDIRNFNIGPLALERYGFSTKGGFNVQTL